ncbi:MAG: FIST C-terminal domain-containing protein [Sphingobacteriales bacterium JAD_PAG50586_3]|nr:MAG: FIST C-terminal domain-containing protein [Sphingobacteriales bacterium JAD_PAG50586_3]
MKIGQLQWSKQSGWKPIAGNVDAEAVQLVMVFGSTGLLKDNTLVNEAKSKYPNARFIGCSTSGEIMGTSVVDETISVSALQFDSTTIVVHSIAIEQPEHSYEAGKQLVNKFDKEGLKHLFVLSDGLNVNGSRLVMGLRESLPEGVSVTGGLTGDGADFAQTLVVNNHEHAGERIITAIGFYGDKIKIGYGSFGGWDSFGMERLITKSKDNVLYELDGEPALALYKSFLGSQAANLPSSGLLFPLSLRASEDHAPVVRTILAVNEEDQSLTFAGDLPEGSYVRLMKANIDRLIDGAVTAANTSIAPFEGSKPDFAVLISCVGRKLVLKQMVEEEVEGVKNILGGNTAITGFYSYGEISPFEKDTRCELHNQTMTITTFTETV